VVVLVILRSARRLGSTGWAVALGLLLGGALGNLTDRLLRQPGFGVGHVVDFIEYLKFPFISFPVFNLADSCIVSAACLIAVLGWRDIPLTGRQDDRNSSLTGADPDA
jgi:signal peptidase II